MGLINKTFEGEENNAAAEAGTTNAAAAAAAAPVAAAAAAPVAVKPANTALGAPIALNALDSMKDLMRVEYNTLSQMTAQQGSIMDRETKTVLGDTVVFNLLSWQDSFVVSPEDDDAPDDVVRYSDDGIMCTDGTTVADTLAEMKLTYPKAKLKQRAVVVGAVESAIKTSDFNGKLVQFDLSPASRTQWKRYMAEAAYALAVGSKQPEQIKRIKVTTRIANGTGNTTYTLAQFAVAD